MARTTAFSSRAFREWSVPFSSWRCASRSPPRDGGQQTASRGPVLPVGAVWGAERCGILGRRPAALRSLHQMIEEVREL